MKYINSILAACFVAGTLFGCTAENDVVVLMGAAQTCDPSSTDNTYENQAGFCLSDPSKIIKTSVHVMNYITGETPWTSSGSSSSSGSTLEPEHPNKGAIFIKKIVFSCKSINDNEQACEGKDDYVQIENIPVSGSGGGACLGIRIKDIYKAFASEDSYSNYIKYANAYYNTFMNPDDKRTAKELANDLHALGVSGSGFDKVKLDVKVTYRDASNIKGTTSTIPLKISVYAAYSEGCLLEKPEADKDSTDSGDSSGSGDSGKDDKT